MTIKTNNVNNVNNSVQEHFLPSLRLPSYKLPKQQYHIVYRIKQDGSFDTSSPFIDNESNIKTNNSVQEKKEDLSYHHDMAYKHILNGTDNNDLNDTEADFVNEINNLTDTKENEINKVRNMVNSSQNIEKQDMCIFDKSVHMSDKSMQHNFDQCVIDTMIEMSDKKQCMSYMTGIGIHNNKTHGCTVSDIEKQCQDNKFSINDARQLCTNVMHAKYKFWQHYDK